MSKRRFLLYNSHTGKSRLVYPTMTATTRLYMCLIFLFGSLVWEVGQAAIVCPPMPDKITQVNRDVRSDIQVGVGSLGKIKAGEIATKTEVVAKNLFEKYPNIDRLLTVQMMAATYCSMIKDSTSMSEGEKQDRWEKFQERVFSFIDPNYPKPSSPREPSGKEPAKKSAPTSKQGTSKPSQVLAEQAERPWVGIRSIEIPKPPAEGQTVRIKINILNGGKSPALYANAYTDFDFWMTNEGDEDIPINEAKIKECTKPKTTWSNALSGIMILPGVTSIFIDQESPIITKEVADLFAKKTITADPNAPYFKNIPRPKTFQTNKTGVLWLYVRGCIDYFDQFRNPYRTSLCQIYEPSEHTPSGVFSPCRKGGNEAD